MYDVRTVRECVVNDDDDDGNDGSCLFIKNCCTFYLFHLAVETHI